MQMGFGQHTDTRDDFQEQGRQHMRRLHLRPRRRDRQVPEPPQEASRETVLHPRHGQQLRGIPLVDGAVQRPGHQERGDHAHHRGRPLC